MDTLDYTGPQVNRGSKGVWLGLGEPRRELPQEFSAPELPTGIDQVEVYCPGCLVLGGESLRRVDLGAAHRGELVYPERTATEAADLQRIAAHPAFTGWMLLVLVDDPAAAVATDMSFLWTTFTRFEPATDIHSAGRRIVSNHAALEPPVLIDARLDPGFPTELFPSEATRDLVDRRWREYFPG